MKGQEKEEKKGKEENGRRAGEERKGEKGKHRETAKVELKNNHQLFSWKSTACIVPIFTSLKVFFTNKMPNSSFITSKQNFPSRNSFNG